MPPHYFALLNKVMAVEVCDARGDAISTEVRLPTSINFHRTSKKIKLKLRTGKTFTTRSFCNINQ